MFGKNNVASVKSATLDSAFSVYPTVSDHVVTPSCCSNKSNPMLLIDQQMDISCKSSEGKEPLKRWNRTDDKKLFQIIRDVSKSSEVTLDDVIDCVTNNESSPYWAKIFPLLRSQGKYQYKTKFPFHRKLDWNLRLNVTMQVYIVSRIL